MLLLLRSKFLPNITNVGLLSLLIYNLRHTYL